MIGSTNIPFLVLIVGSWFVAGLVITARTAIHSILFLISLFAIVSVVLIGWFKLHFIGILYLVVYVGAIAVLFLFIIIIIPSVQPTGVLHSKLLRIGRWLFGVGLLACILLIYNSAGLTTWVGEIYSSDLWPVAWGEDDLYLVSEALYYRYSFALVAAAFLLFVALVLAVLLCQDERVVNKISFSWLR